MFPFTPRLRGKMELYKYIHSWAKTKVYVGGQFEQVYHKHFIRESRQDKGSEIKSRMGLRYRIRQCGKSLKITGDQNYS